MKKVFVVLLMCLFVFSGCTTFTLNSQEKRYTYDELDDNQKKIVLKNILNGPVCMIREKRYCVLMLHFFMRTEN